MALAADYTPQDVARRVRRGSWARSQRGVYVRSDVTGDRRGAALAHLTATHARLAAPHVFSHDSAALLWGLALWCTPRVTHVYQRSHPGAGGEATIRRHRAPLPPGAATLLDGLPVTTLEQTVVDCARTMSPLAGLVVADSALRAGASRDDILEMLARRGAAPGTARARAVVSVADGGAESPWESATRFVLLAAGLPAPSTQVMVATRLGVFWADMGWEEWRLLIEYDGRPKYTGPEALVREKRRQDAVVETGVRLLRVTKEDVRAHGSFVRRVRGALPPDLPLIRRPHLRGS